jgi:hypothetical protein
MNLYHIILLMIAIVGLYTFATDFRKKRIRWWGWILLVISVLMITEVLLSLFAPHVITAIID